MTRLEPLMLVSADAGPRLRREVDAGLRPCPEFLRLETLTGIRLLDWTAFDSGRGHRSVARSLRHILTALPELRHVRVVLSDGEHLGIPLALVMRSLRIRTPHVIIGHHLMTRTKAPFFRIGKVHRRIDRILVHSSNQVRVLTRDLRVPASLVRVVPYGIDTEFWSPRRDDEEEALIASVGREHRDWETLVDACAGMARVCIADASQHSPNAHRQEPAHWPECVERVALDHVELRKLYARATVVAVPLIPTDVPFGITTVLEAMAMGKAVVVSATTGMRELVDDGETGLIVPPGDAAALSQAVGRLLADPQERRRLGSAARKKTVEQYGLDVYAKQLAQQLEQVGQLEDLVDAGHHQVVP